MKRLIIPFAFTAAYLLAGLGFMGFTIVGAPAMPWLKWLVLVIAAATLVMMHIDEQKRERKWQCF